MKKESQWGRARDRVRIRNRVGARRGGEATTTPVDGPTVVGLSPTLRIRGLLATRDIAVGELIESSPVVLIPVAQKRALEATVLGNYFFDWTDDHNALVMGEGSLINHSYSANAEYRCDVANGVMEFRAVKPIRRGAEVTINYNGEPDNPTPIDLDYGLSSHIRERQVRPSP